MSSLKTVEGKEHVKNGVNRLVFAALSIILETLVIMAMAFRFNEYAEWVEVFTHTVAFIMILGIYSQYRTAAMKMPWVVLIMAFPVFGITLYLLIGLDGATYKMRRRYERIDGLLMPRLSQNENIASALKAENPEISNISWYIRSSARYPLYDNTDVRYYPDASLALNAMLKDLAHAEKFIFMEYYAIEDKESWARVEEVLLDRVAHGVEVRVFYDDVGSIGFVNKDFVKRLEAKGIRARLFNPVAPVLDFFLNNRDHRKLTVIDGKIGYTGGYNIANEYFNINSPYGYWKDTGIRLEGEAVRSMTATILESWNAIRGDDVDDHDFTKYLPMAGLPGDAAQALTEADGTAEAAVSAEALVPTEASVPAQSSVPSTEKSETQASAQFVQPYADSPLDNEHVGENVYISLVERARDYIYFVTPYLIITDEMNYVLGMAAKRGVDVRIITPGIPDKRTVYQVTRSYYARLVRNGVRIYEYTPGFCHCKMCVSDDEVATCGTINLDYRSFYHHFENGTLLYGGSVIGEIRRDFEDMMASSQEVTEKYKTGRSSVLRLGQLLLRFLAPLL